MGRALARLGWELLDAGWALSGLERAWDGPSPGLEGTLSFLGKGALLYVLAIFQKRPLFMET